MHLLLPATDLAANCNACCAVCLGCWVLDDSPCMTAAAQQSVLLAMGSCSGLATPLLTFQNSLNAVNGIEL